jgi:hypothetical protein
MTNSSPFRIVLVRADPNYGARYHKGNSAAHSLYAYLKHHCKSKRSVSVDIIELNSCWRYAKDLDVNWILDRMPDLIGFSCYCWNIDIVIDLAKIIKRVQPELQIVVGGPETSFQASEILIAYPEIDIVVRGEGEATFCELVEIITDGKMNIKDLLGVTYRHGNKVVSNEDRPPITDLDTIPSPFLDGIINPSMIDGEVMIETVRGCPYKCIYCLHTKGIKGVRSYSWDRIKSEIEYLCLNPNIKVIWFADATFDFDESRSLRIMDLILNLNPLQRVAFELRAELLTNQILERLKLLNVEDLGIGLQTVNQGTLSTLQRPSDIKLIRDNLLALKEVLHNKDTCIFVDLIYGLPGDHFEDYQKSVDFVIEVGGRVYYQPLRVFRGTVMAKEAEKLGVCYLRDAPHNAIYCTSFGIRDMKKAYQLNAGLDFYQSEIQVIKYVLEALSDRLGLSLSYIFTWLGSVMWNVGLRRWFRVGNASPEDMPSIWRIEDVLMSLDHIDTLKPNCSMEVEDLRDLLRGEMEKFANRIGRSGYYHAAI